MKIQEIITLQKKIDNELEKTKNEIIAKLQNFFSNHNKENTKTSVWINEPFFDDNKNYYVPYWFDLKVNLNQIYALIPLWLALSGFLFCLN